MKTRKIFNSHNGFTLIELLVVISIIGLLASTILASLNFARAKARDTRRLVDLKQIQNALELYYSDNGFYPPVTVPPVPGWVGGSYRGWEVSYKGDFLESLQPYIAKTPLDPLNVAHEDALGDFDAFFSPRPLDGNFFYMYHNYASGKDYGCPWKGPFAVVGFRAFEKMDATHLPQARCGPMPCNPGVPNVCRDWSLEFDYSVFLVK